uniref:PLAT domain-containing protein n=1 Tax=Anguilla anguilla TaxID=7936 RepID=A0A0E9VUJ7_ANGAN
MKKRFLNQVIHGQNPTCRNVKLTVETLEVGNEKQYYLTAW